MCCLGLFCMVFRCICCLDIVFSFFFQYIFVYQIIFFPFPLPLPKSFPLVILDAVRLFFVLLLITVFYAFSFSLWACNPWTMVLCP